MGKTPTVNWYDQFVRNITISGGLVPMGLYIPRLLELLAEGEIDPEPHADQHALRSRRPPTATA